jgi:hypothetical protein
MFNYYPEQRHALELTTIRRERLLPEDAIGSVEIEAGKRVNLRDVVARGTVPARYVIVEAAEFFGLRNPDQLAELMQVEIGNVVDDQDLLAARGRRRLFSPVRGIVAYIGEGRIIIQETPELIDLEAGVDGQVIEVRPGRGVVIEMVGALVQGVWGNNKRALGPLQVEPEDGLETIFGDQLDIKYQGAIVVTRRPLKPLGIQVMEEQGLRGVIAPSMDTDMIEQALNANGAIMLTEGFGAVRMSAALSTMFANMRGRQAMLDAFTPNRTESRRPEVIMNPTGRTAARPPQPDVDVALRTGMNVRLTRSPYAGQVGQVVHLPKSPVLLENGLRVMCAQVALSGGDRVFVPLANLEIFGK